MSTTQAPSFAGYTEQLRSMADELRTVAASGSIAIGDLLETAAANYGTTPSQMRYALSFAGVKNLVKIDYDSATVTAVPR